MKTLLTTLLTFLLVISSQVHSLSLKEPIQSERLNRDTASQVKVGMSLREVTSLIGQPALTLPDFNTNEMLDAYFHKSKINFNERHNKEEGVTLTYCSHSLSLVFDNNVLIKIKEAYRYKCG